jgi:hypothetical protein
VLQLLTKIIMTKSLYNLRNEEECELYRMLLQHTMGILQYDRIVLVLALKESNGNHGRHRCPEKQMLVKKIIELTRYGIRYILALRSRRTLPSK